MLASLAAACGSYRANLDDATKLLPDRYPALVVRQAAEATPLDRYWRAFGSIELDRLVEVALAGNRDLRAATARVRAAGFGARVAWSDRLPHFDVEASLAATAAGSSSTHSSGWTAKLGVAGSYELDLWGRDRARHRSAVARFQQARWDLRAARMTIAAEVTLRWLELRAARAQLVLLESQTKTVSRTATVLERRFKQGGARWTDLLAQRQTLAGIEAQRATIRRNLDTARAELRLLLGSAKRSPKVGAPAIGATEELPEPPPLPALGLPAKLVKQRPDVQSAWYALLSAAWRASAAQAERLPTLSIGGSFAFGAATPPDLLQSWIAQALAGLTGPLFHFGARKAAADAARATADAARAALEQALLAAFRDVECALAANRHLTARATATTDQAKLAAQRAKQLAERYRNGTGTYLELYLAELEQIRAEQVVLAVRADLLAQRVQLARALGGGWREAESNRRGRR